MHDNKTVTFDASQYQLVPKVPTDEMLDAASHASMQHLLDCINDPVKARELGSEENARKTHASRYQSMLDAAPTPAAQSAGQEAVARILTWKGEGHPPLTTIAARTYAEYSIEDARDSGCWEEGAKLYAAPVNGGERTDHDRLVRELDVLLNGEHAASQASLCDIVSQVRAEGIRSLNGGERYAELEREHFGDPDKRTGIYADAPQVGGDAELMCRRLRNMGLGTCDEAADFIERLAALTSPAKVNVGLHPAIREGVEAAFEGRDGWHTKIAAAARHLPTEDAKVGGDEREAFEAHAKGLGMPLHGHGGYYSNIRTRNMWLGWQARAALSADGGEDKRDE